MSLTNIVYTPVDTGTAKIRPKGENANWNVFYLLAGKNNLGSASLVFFVKSLVFVVLLKSIAKTTMIHKGHNERSEYLDFRTIFIHKLKTLTQSQL